MRATSLAVAASALLTAFTPSSSGAATPVLERNPGRLAATASLGGGLEAGTTSNGLGELELTAGYEIGDVRPELGLLLGLAPSTDYLALRPGLHVTIPQLPIYGRGALDFSNERHGWKVRWVMLGAGLETRLTSEMGAFAEADVGLPMASDFGLGLLFRAGFSFRF